MNKVIVFATILVSILFADPVVRTGQISSYGQSSNNPVPHCRVRDDGCYRAGEEFNYTRNSKGIVIDHVTNLEWQDTPIKNKDWYGSKNYCNALSLDGGGWRLPTIRELETLVNYTKSHNVVDDIFENVRSGNYWSLNEYENKSNPDKAWIVRFQSWGYSLPELKTNDVVVEENNETNTTSTTYYYERCVRGPSYGNSDFYRSNNIVTDRANGLEWQDDANAKNIKKNWIGTINYCEGLTLGSYTDWRLPNQKELLTIADRTKYNPIIDKTVFQNCASGTYKTNARYISSTTRVGHPDTIDAWFVHFGRGENYYNDKNDTTYHVRCVRENISPTADAGPDQNVNEGDAVTLDGSASSDADGTISSYLWEEGNTVLSHEMVFSKSDFSIGTHTIILTVTDNDGATDSNSTEVKIKDITPPVITLKGSNPMSIVQDSTFTDPGATATDNVDGTVPVIKSGTVDTSKVGSYTRSYTATDAAGNTATKTRTVNVLDVTPPVITLKGANPMNIVQGSTFTDPGATATDDVDGSVPVTASGTVDTSKVGPYTLTYSATDGAGNTATETRIVEVKEVTTPPPTLPDWITETVTDDGKTVTYTAAGNDSAVELDASVKDNLDITANNDGVVFKAKSPLVIGSCQVRVSIIMKSDGDLLAGYTHEGNGCSNDIDAFTPGTTAVIGKDMLLRIDAPLTRDLVLGDK